MKNKCENCTLNKEGGEGCSIKRSLMAFDVRNKTGSIVIKCEKFRARGGYYRGKEILDKTKEM